jgi:putative endonuclease
VSFVFLLNMKNTREKGNKGEEIACFYLKKHGFFVQERNYLKKWGEIDIIAIKDQIIHFVEVKSIIDKGNKSGYRPEENVHKLKQKRLRRTIQTYLNERKYGLNAEFKFHIIVIKFNETTGKSKVSILEDIIL